MTFSNYTSEKSLSLAYPPAPVIDGKVSFDLYSTDFEKFDGSLHLMAIVWSDDGVGAATGTALVRSPVVAKLAMPRFVASGDTTIIPLTLDNVQGNAGKYEIDLTAPSPLKISDLKGPGTITDAGDTKKITVPLDTGQKVTYVMALSTPASSENEKVQVKVDVRGAEPSNVTESSTRLWDVNLRPPFAPSARLMSFQLAPGASRTVNAELLGDLRKKIYVPDTLQVVARIAPAIRPSTAVASGLARDLPPISLDALAAAGTVLIEDGSTPATQAELKRIVNEVVALQTNGGGFLGYRTSAPEQASGDEAVVQKTDLLHTAAAVEFLGKAAGAGVPVPAEAQAAGLDFLAGEVRKFLQNNIEDFPTGNEACDSGRVLAALVLSQRGRMEDADVKAIYSRCSGPELSLKERAALAEMLETFGEKGSAHLVLAKFPEEIPADQSLQDLAEAWAHLLAAKAPKETTDKLLNRLIVSGNAAQALPIEALAWISRGAETLAKQDANAKFDVSLKPGLISKKDASSITTHILGKGDIDKGVEIRNTGDAPAVVTLTVRGQSDSRGAAAEQGMTVRRRIFTAAGEELTGDKIAVKQNALLYVILEGLSLNRAGASKDQDAAAVLIDTLPTGFEIVRSDIFEDTPANKYLNEHRMLDLTPQGGVDRTEARDDHWLAIVRPAKKDPKDAAAGFRAGYAVRATAAGTFVLPPAVAEDYSSPEISAFSAGTHQLIVQREE